MAEVEAVSDSDENEVNPHRDDLCNETRIPETQPVRTTLLCPSRTHTLPSFIVGQDAYTFAPVEPLGAQSLTIHRSTGDIVLNRKLSHLANHTALPDARHIQRPTPLHPLLPRGTRRRYTGYSE